MEAPNNIDQRRADLVSLIGQSNSLKNFSGKYEYLWAKNPLEIVSQDELRQIISRMLLSALNSMEMSEASKSQFLILRESVRYMTNKDADKSALLGCAKEAKNRIDEILEMKTLKAAKRGESSMTFEEARAQLAIVVPFFEEAKKVISYLEEVMAVEDLNKTSELIASSHAAVDEIIAAANDN